jgi:hypothetical protein
VALTGFGHYFARAGHHVAGSPSMTALSAFDEDYWRRPRPTFPYLEGVVKMISLPSFWFPTLTPVTENLGRPHYERTWAMNRISNRIRVPAACEYRD